MVSSRHPSSSSKDDDTTISSSSNSSSNGSSSNNGSGTSSSQQSTSRTKNRNKKRREQQKLQQQTLREEKQGVVTSSLAAGLSVPVRYALLSVPFLISALLVLFTFRLMDPIALPIGYGKAPLPMTPSTVNRNKSAFSMIGTFTEKVIEKPEDTNSYFAAATAGAPDKIDTSSPAAVPVSATAGERLVQILSSTTITVYGEKEETFTNGQSATPMSLSSYYLSSSSCTLGSSCSGARIYRPAPSLCSDGYTYGYSDWNALRTAIHNLNDEQHDWNNRRASSGNYNNPYYDLGVMAEGVDDDSMNILYEETLEPFIICPGVTLRGRNRGGAIYINHPDIRIECEGCTLDLARTHFRFGSEAKGVVIRGLTLMGASTSSLLFHENGAEASFEDCTWINNSGLTDIGAVADLNSTSSVSFFRCEISDSKQSPLVLGSPGSAVVGSSLTIRN